MTYNKPEIVKLDSALKMIQGTTQKVMGRFDTFQQPFLTCPAYEADE